MKNWTSKFPGEYGYYWIRYRYNDSKIYNSCIVKVIDNIYNPGETIMLFHGNNNEKNINEFQNVVCELNWWGPIMKPND